MESLEAFFVWLVRVSWQGTVLIGLIVLVQWLFQKRLSPSWRYGLWLLVLARLLMPATIESPTSIFNLSPWKIGSAATAESQTRNEAARISIETASNAEAVEVTIVGETNQSPGSRHENPSVNRFSANPATRETTSRFTSITFQAWLSTVWFAGAGFFAVRLVWQNSRFARRVLKRRQVTQSSALEVLEDCKQSMRLRTPVTIIETREVNSPALYGFIRPRMVLPKGTLASFAPAELRYIFLHELAHIKRCDMAVNWVATTLCVLHWFNPVVWLAFRRMAADREVAADALVLSHTSETEQQPYGQTIIRLLEEFARPVAQPGVVGILEDKQQMRRRIAMIAQFKKTSGWPVMALTLLLGLGVVALTDAQTRPTDVKGGQKLISHSALSLKSNSSDAPVIKPFRLPDSIRNSDYLAISPDGRKVAFVSGITYSDVKVMDLENDSIVNLTDRIPRDPKGYVTSSPVWSPNGDSVVFAYSSGTNRTTSLWITPARGADAKSIYTARSRIEPLDWSRDGKWILTAIGNMPIGNQQVRSVVAIPVEGGDVRQVSSGEWKGESARLSPDGKFAVFERTNDGQQGIFLLRIDDGTEIPIGPEDQAKMSPVWSPDGHYVLFKGSRDGTYNFWAQRVENGQEVESPVRLQVDAGPQTMLTRVLDDGRLVYSSWSPGTGVYRVSINPETGETLGKPRLVILGRDGAPSPDGRWLAYNSFDWGSGAASSLGLRLASVDGREERTIRTDLVNPFVLGWFPDGRSLLLGGFEATGKRGLYRIELATGKLETSYTANAFLRNGRLSPDGRTVAFAKPTSATGWGLFVIKMEIGSKPVLLYSDPDGFVIDPSWSPDGKSLAVAAQHRGASFSRILSIAVDGGELKEIVRHDEYGPAATADFPRLLFNAWSPNGGFIAYDRIFFQGTESSESEVRDEVWLVRTADGQAFHLKELGNSSSHLHWSADGSELFYTHQDPKGPVTEYWTLQNYLPGTIHAESK